MSDVIDLSKADDDADDDVNNEPPAKRFRPSQVYIAIHDKEPQDYGSDYNYSSFLPSRQDTKIVGVYYSYENVVSSATEYAENEFGLGEEEDEDDDSDSGPLGHIVWNGEGWFRREESDANECNDRVHIREHAVS
jgi:hypothetical protein